MIDVAKVRADTPGAANVIHFNNAGSSLPPRQVVDAVVGYLRLEEQLGGYEAEAHAADQLGRLYGAAAELIGCDDAEIAFTASASDAWWRAFSAVELNPGDRVLFGHSAFQTNAFGLMQAADRGVVVDVVPNDAAGDLDLAAMDNMMDERVKLVCLTQVSMANGAVQPAVEVGARAKAAGAIYLLDACQSAGQLALDVGRLGCDFLVFTGRKFVRGPRGTGVLYAGASVIDRLGPTPFVDGRSAEWTGATSFEYQSGARRFEFGEQNFAGKAGLAVAIDYAIDIGLESIETRIAELSSALRAGLDGLPGVTVRDEGSKKSGIVTFTVDGHSCSSVQAELGRNGINVSAPGRRNAQLDIGHRGIDAVVRAGVHYYNTEAEVLQLIEVVGRL